MKKKFSLLKTNIFIFLLLFIGIFLFLKHDSAYYYSYVQRVRGKISTEKQLALSGFDIGPDGWLPFYETADYLKKTIMSGETVFIWGSVVTTYVLADKQPISWFVYKYPLLPDELRVAGFRKWFPDFEENRRKMMAELFQESPDYLIIEVSPEKVFDEMISFSDFSNFIFKNYKFGKQIGNILIYKRKSKPDALYDLSNNYKVIPQEIIKRYAIINQIKNENRKTTINFTPIVNTAGITRELEIVYPNNISVNFNQIDVQFFAQDGSDFVGNSNEKPSKMPDLHVKVKSLFRQLRFACLKFDNIIWSNRPYGVNRYLKVIQNGDIFDLFFEPVSIWKGATFEIYFIYEDGTLAKTEVLVN